MEKPETKTVLVVDDEPDVRLFVEAALEDAGFKVVTAANGHEAYNRVKEKAPDFITLDLVMPQQSGALFYLKLRKNTLWKSIPVMVVSAHVQDEMGEADFKRLMKGQEAPAPDVFMEKPVDPLVLAQIVAKALDVDLGDFANEAAADARGEVMDRLRNADLETLSRIREVLGKDPK